jgi:hypothetical protein
MKNLDKNKLYKINPEIDEWEIDTYKVASIEKDGVYFHRFVDNKHEASEWAWFNNIEIEDLVEA